MNKIYYQIFALLTVILLSACTIQLAPDYDKDLVEALDSANEETMAVFASLSEGSAQSEYPQYKERYSAVIGKYSALKQRAATRQMPPLSKQLNKVKFVSDKCSDPTSCVNTSPQSIESVIENLKLVQTTHRKIGLDPDVLEGFERRHVIVIQQALFVERALKR